MPSTTSWKRRYLPEIQRILGEVLFRSPRCHDLPDGSEGLIRLSIRKTHIVCRVAQQSLLRQDVDRFSLPCADADGRDQEFQKVLCGWGDYLFFGLAYPGDARLAAWFLGDLQVFRGWADAHWFAHQDWPGELRGARRGGTYRRFRLRDMPREFVVAQGAVSPLAA